MPLAVPAHSYASHAERRRALYEGVSSPGTRSRSRSRPAGTSAVSSSFVATWRTRTAADAPSQSASFIRPCACCHAAPAGPASHDGATDGCHSRNVAVTWPST